MDFCDLELSQAGQRKKGRSACMGPYCDQVVLWIERFTPQEWMYVLIGLVFAGFVFLRGFGSRSGY